MEKPERRIDNLRAFIRVWGACIAVSAFIMFFLPSITQGTAFHAYIAEANIQFGLGLLLGPLYSKGAMLVVRYFQRTGRDISNDPRFLVGLIVVIMPLGTIIYYLALRLLDHEGNWCNTLTFSWNTLYTALFVNAAMIPLVGLNTMTLINYMEGKNILLRNGNPSKFRHVVMTIVLPAVILLLALVIIKFWQG